MQSQRLKFSLRGVLSLIGIFLLIIFCAMAILIFNNLKSVEQNVLNLREQVNTATNKIQDITKTSKTSTEMFLAVTKEWQDYKNEEFNFQFKGPADWGKFVLVGADDIFQAKSEILPVGKSLVGSFEQLTAFGLRLNIKTYNSNDGQPQWASMEVRNALVKSVVGGCGEELFEKLKNLKLGELRNCSIKENIFGQKYLIYHYVNKADDQVTDVSVAVYPRDNFSINITLPVSLTEECNYFLQSVVFL